MNPRFEVKILDEVFKFFDGIEEKAVDKILFNIRKSRQVIDKELFKKLENEIWELRTIFNKKISSHENIFIRGSNRQVCW